MAGIDKTYTDSWSEYCQLKDWANKNRFTCPDGTKVDINNYIYNWDESHFRDGNPLPVMNTSQVADYFLIKNCPLEFVQKRMEDVYGTEYFESVKKGTSVYDKFSKEGKYGKHIRLIRRPSRMINKPHVRKSARRRWNYWYVQLDNFMWYSEERNKWVWENELSCTDWTNTARVHTIKALKRMLIKWKLPIGTKVRVFGNWMGERYEFEIIK